MEKNIKLSSTNSIVKEVKDKYGKLSDIKGNFDLLDNFKTVEIDDIGINALFINLKRFVVQFYLLIELNLLNLTLTAIMK